jgi:signal transduction histidine kinase
VLISVKDNGTGIEPEALEKIFIPFFSTKKTGSGIGLSLSRQIMRQHEGNIAVKSEMGEGTEFVLRF